jgi:tetratricopeptide (TPR) repeat protein
LLQRLFDAEKFMKQTFFTNRLFLFLAFAVLFVQTAFTQTSERTKLSKLDQTIQAGLDSARAGKFSEAATRFEDAQKIFDKEKQPSEFLFTLFTLPDEDNSAPPTDPRALQIINYRHATATKQALLQFLAYANQLDGNSAQAEKYQTAVYDLQGVLWGLSWRLFAPRFYKVFDDKVKDGKGENFGRYQYLAAALLLDAGGEFDKVFSLLQSAQQNAPKNADVAGLLANAFLQKRNRAEAKRQAELSLSLKPDQKSVLIDLATAELFLNEIDNSIKHAEAAARIDAQAPGPRLTLALDYIEKKDFARGLKEAAAAVELSGRHPFYLTVQAAAMEAAGDFKGAEKILREVYGKEMPSFEDLDKWYINETLRNLILKTVKRIDKPKGDA